MKKFLFFLSIVFVGRLFAQTKSDTTIKKETWSLGIVAGSTYSGSGSGGTKSPSGGLNSGLTARIYLKKNRFISTGLLFNQFKYYLGYSVTLPYGYPNNFYNSFFHVYSIPVYFNFQSQGDKSRYYFGFGAETLYWRENASLAPSETRIKYWLGAKAGLTFKRTGKYSFFIEAIIRETNVPTSYPGSINFRTASYNPYLIFGINAGLLYNF
ncbi:MAG TPA: hypothetical protein VNZ49_11585 [Bacteroidia bacterium]|jgi:hypothetical protein|nr:hypothetical protein [Bacteroidia bacterium]